MKALFRFFGWFIWFVFSSAVPTVLYGQSSDGECWTWLNPLPQGNQLDDVFFVDAQTGWAVGWAGTILKTTDGGETWVAQNAGTNYNLEQIRFIDPQHGWMRDYNNLYATTDGGTNWIPVTTPPGQIGYFYFTSPSEGFVVLRYTNTVYKTTDSGVNWVKVNAGGELAPYNNNYFFLDAQTGWGIHSAGGIVKTTNGGITWTPQNAGNTSNLTTIHFVDEQNGWIIAGSNWDTLLRTTNGGQTWVAKKVAGYTALSGISFADPLTGWMNTGSGILKSVDGGLNWSLQYSASAYLTKSYAINTQKVFSIGSAGQILTTSNGGQSWTSKSTGFTDDLLDVQFVNNQTGWVVSNNGKIYKTTNGGTTWTKQYDNSNTFLADAFFSSTQIGWAVGSGGIVMKTTNGGQNWTSQFIGGGLGLNSVYFVDSQIGWTAGYNGKIYKTTNGGQNWTQQNSTVSVDLYDAFFINSQTGWIVGNTGTVLKTTNGGASWSAKTIGTGTLQNIFFIDALNGWITNGSLYKTSDGGDTWTNIYVNGLTGGASLGHAFFVDASKGWFCNHIGNAGGGICSTENGGFSGSYQSNADFMQSLHFLNAQTGWAVGLGGSILKYSGPSVPSCISDIFLDQKTDVPVDATISWPYPAGCPMGYVLTIGTSPGSSDIEDPVFLWSNTTSWTPTNTLPPGDTIYVNISPSNGSGTASGCPEFSFITANESVKDTLPPCIGWQNTIGGSGYETGGFALETSDGGFILGGPSESNISGDKNENSKGGRDYWLVKLNAAGSIEWQKTIGGSGYDNLTSLQQTSDGGYIVGGNSESDISGDKTENSRGGFDYWIVKLNASGVIQWQKTIGGNGGDFLYAIRQTSDGGYIVGGYSDSNASGDKTDNSKGFSDYWVVKLNSVGVTQWQKTIGGNGDDIISDLQQTSDGGYILGGHTDSGISGDKTENNLGIRDYWIVKLNTSGSITGQKTIGGTGDDALSAIRQTPDGGYILCGNSSSGISGNKTENNRGNWDYWVLKLDGGYNIEWQKTIGGAMDDTPKSILITLDGGYIIAGQSISAISGDKTEPNNGSYDLWLVKLNSSGGVQWQKTIGGDDSDFIESFQLTSDGTYLAGGTSRSGISGDKTENSQGSSDFWVLNLTPASTPACIPTIPLHQQTNVPTDTKITWPDTPGCEDAYRLSLGTTPGGSDILNNQVVADTMYQPAQPLPAGQTIYVRITPYNGVGEASGCTEFSFVTAANNCDAVSDSSELVQLYIATGGDNWTKKTNWRMPGQPISSWYGITVNAQGCVTCIDLDGKPGCSGGYTTNNLSGQLPNINLPQLESLFLSGNQLNGSIPDFTNLPSLKNFHCSENLLTNSIPNFTSLTNLQVFYCSSNQLTGSIPDFTNLPNLQTFDCSGNQLIGSIPDFTNLPSLQNLYCPSNQLSGSIPNFSNLPSLQVINCFSNQLSGSIPDFTNLQNLWWFYCLDNQLNGNIPDFTNLPNLQFFNCNDNQLNGSIPDFTNLPFLREFDCRNNLLTGSIPNFTNLPNLQRLDCTNNHLSGSIPDFTNQINLKTFYCLDNQFTFEDILSSYPAIKNKVQANNGSYEYARQDTVFYDTLLVRNVGQNLDFTLDFDENISSNIYKWYKDGIYQSNQDQTGNNNLVINNLQPSHAGNWTVEVTNPNVPFLTLFSDTIRLQVCSPITNLQIAGPTALCAGTAVLSATPGFAQYAWSGGQDTSDVSVTSANTYTVTVTDANGCTGTASKTVGTSVPAPAPQISGPATLCSGIAMLSATPGFAQYAWSSGQDTSDISVTSASTYTVTVTDANGCTGTAAQTISGNTTPPAPVITGPPLLCSGGTTLSAPGNYTAWQWSNGQSGTDSITVSAEGTYTVTVTDASGCTGTDTQSVSGTGASPAPVITGPTSICSGSIVLMAAGNFSNWQWSNGQSGAQNNITVMAPGAYAVLVTASNGCTGADTVVVSSQGPPSAGATPTLAGCGLSNGSINLTVSGGTPGYTFLWSNGATAEDPQNLPAGTYAVTVTDAANCSATASAVVSNPNAPSAAAVPTQAGCGLSNGSINLTVSGGTPGYTFLWSNGATAEDPQNLAGGTYTVTITDQANCSATASATVGNPGFPSAIATPAPATCGLPNGRINLSVQGGTPPYNYLWSNGTTGKDLSGVPTGTYTVTVSDQAGCTATASAAIAGPLPLTTANLLETCLPAKTAYNVSLTLNGGTPPYALVAGGGNIAGNQFNSPAITSGTPYSFSFTDTQGCGPLQVNGSRDCSCRDTIQIDTTICAGGIFQYKNLQFGQAGDYSDTIATPTGCDTLLLLRLQTIQPQVDIIGDDFLCQGEISALVLQVQGCTGCKFAWNNADISGAWGEVMPLLTTTYAVTVTDNRNCTASDSLIVTVQAPVTTQVEATICPGGQSEVCGQVFDKAGTYQVACYTSAGCDSTIILTLQVVSDLRVEAYPDTFYLRSSQDEGVFDVALNDSLVANSAWTLDITEDGQHGRAVPEPDGRVRYRLDNGAFYGIDSFLYRVCSNACPDKCDSSSVIVVVQNTIPNAFSPDNDGYNDTFDPFGWHLENDRPNPVPTSAILTIWNRWDEVVFRADPYPENGWDGRSLTGKRVPQGTYYYTLQMSGGETELIRGVVQVLVSGK